MFMHDSRCCMHYFCISPCVHRNASDLNLQNTWTCVVVVFFYRAPFTDILSQNNARQIITWNRFLWLWINSYEMAYWWKKTEVLYHLWKAIRQDQLPITWMMAPFSNHHGPKQDDQSIKIRTLIKMTICNSFNDEIPFNWYESIQDYDE